MTLLELLVKELPKRGGWPDFAHHVTKHSNFTHVYFYDEVGNPPEHIDLISIFMGITSDTETITREQYEAAIAAQQPDWDGEGLPPVGVEFEYGAHRSVAKCIAISYHHVFASKGDPDNEEGDYEEFLIDIGASSFRPIRTEADRKREDAQCAIGQIMINNRGIGAELFIAGEIYSSIAAGKIPGVEISK